MATRISSKGQITIPVEIRKQVCLKAGDLLNIKTGEKRTIILLPCQEEANFTMQPAEIIKETAGIWSGLGEDGAEYVHNLRTIDEERWKVLVLE